MIAAAAACCQMIVSVFVSCCCCRARFAGHQNAAAANNHHEIITKTLLPLCYQLKKTTKMPSVPARAKMRSTAPFAKHPILPTGFRVVLEGLFFVLLKIRIYQVLLVVLELL
jgi:hypothetical protein